MHIANAIIKKKKSMNTKEVFVIYVKSVFPSPTGNALAKSNRIKATIPIVTNDIKSSK
jgi:hypothetical protein